MKYITLLLLLGILSASCSKKIYQEVNESEQWQSAPAVAKTFNDFKLTEDRINGAKANIDKPIVLQLKDSFQLIDGKFKFTTRNITLPGISSVGKLRVMEMTDNPYVPKTLEVTFSQEPNGTPKNQDVSNTIKLMFDFEIVSTPEVNFLKESDLTEDEKALVLKNEGGRDSKGYVRGSKPHLRYIIRDNGKISETNLTPQTLRNTNAGRYQWKCLKFDEVPNGTDMNLNKDSNSYARTDDGSYVVLEKNTNAVYEVSNADVRLDIVKFRVVPKQAVIRTEGF
ncbi:hypothetical protein KC901_00690 [Patescibacteria group bacterium]|nr:hypothetical protein [Patescibacteria group bacterium]